MSDYHIDCLLYPVSARLYIPTSVFEAVKDKLPPAYTLTTGVGRWKDLDEPVVIIEVWADTVAMKAVSDTVDAMLDAGEEAVLLVTSSPNMGMIGQVYYKHENSEHGVEGEQLPPTTVPDAFAQAFEGLLDPGRPD